MFLQRTASGEDESPLFNRINHVITAYLRSKKSTVINNNNFAGIHNIIHYRFIILTSLIRVIGLWRHTLRLVLTRPIYSFVSLAHFHFFFTAFPMAKLGRLCQMFANGCSLLAIQRFKFVGVWIYERISFCIVLAFLDPLFLIVVTVNCLLLLVNRFLAQIFLP